MTNYPKESLLRFDVFFVFNCGWNILNLFRAEHYWLFFTDEQFLFRVCDYLNWRLRFNGNF